VSTTVPARRSRNRRQITPGARKDENTGPDLRRQERRGLVGDPGLGDQPVRRKAVRGKAISVGRVVHSCRAREAERSVQHGRFPRVSCRIRVGKGVVRGFCRPEIIVQRAAAKP